MTSEPVVRRLTPDEWQVARAVRVAALTDAPSAFGSTVDREMSLSDDGWRARLSGSAWFVACRGDRVTGLACGVSSDGRDQRGLTGMWVSPPERGDGLAVDLVSRVLAWARADGALWVQLWVVQENTRAISLYEKTGFTRTGRTQPLPRDPRLLEVEMVVALSRTSPEDGAQEP